MKLRLVCASLVIAWAGSACTTENAYTGEKETGVPSSAIGAVAGAAAGAVLGNQVKGSKNSRQNARIAGAAIGAAVGGGVGYHLDNQKKKIEEKFKNTKVRVEKRGDNLVLNMPGEISFETGKAQLKQEMLEPLSGVAMVLKEYPTQTLEISGHTDSRGNAQANQILSEQRAQAVASTLRQNGVNEKRIKTVGYGSSQPVGDNTTDSGRAQNRRVEVVLFPPPSTSH